MAKNSNFNSIRVTVTTAGTPVRISSTPITTPEFEMFVLSANAGANMYIGDSTVDNQWIPRARSTRTSYTSGNADLVKDNLFQLNEIYLDSDGNGDIAIIQYRELK